ncbi:MAG TPA: helix-turn-helix domain-containing protein [Candidatus Tectomicrobia bacterium]
MDHSQEDRRHQAMARYLAGDKIEVICRDLHCAKSWLYKWKARYQADNPAWVTSRSTQPQRKPSQTPPPVVEHILTLSRTLGHQEQQGKAAAIHQELTQQGIEPIPSRRTIYRIILRQEQENH